MGDDLSRPERESLRAPMQWADVACGGFSRAPEAACDAPVIADDQWGYPARNVADQRRDPESLWRWLAAALHLRRSCPEFGEGTVECLAVDDPRVLVHVCRREEHVAVAAHNFSDQEVAVDVPTTAFDAQALIEIFNDGGDHDGSLSPLRLAPSGYRWFRGTDDGRGGRR